MFRKITIAIAVMGVFGAVGLFTSLAYGSGCLIAHREHGKKTEISQASAAEPTNKAEAVGNETCPVSDERIDDKKKVTYEYNGKIYNFCCRDCADEFQKDPKKYIEKMEKEKAEKSRQ